ncbi:hypothetical protein [Aquisphaera giovannonii]|nr:hypothetical protein [Aquisphaera giovannonii]
MRRVVPHLDSAPIFGKPWIADERRIRIPTVGTVDLGPEMGELPFE